jgi:hypothetical protein
VVKDLRLKTRTVGWSVNATICLPQEFHGQKCLQYMSHSTKCIEPSRNGTLLSTKSKHAWSLMLILIVSHLPFETNRQLSTVLNVGKKLEFKLDALQSGNSVILGDFWGTLGVFIVNFHELKNQARAAGPGPDERGGAAASETGEQPFFIGRDRLVSECAGAEYAHRRETSTRFRECFSEKVF